MGKNHRGLIGFVATAFVLGLLLSPTIASAQTGDDRSFVIKAGRVLPVDSDAPWVFEPGVIVVRNGRITAIGSDIEIPADLKVYDYPYATVMPGLVAASTTLAGQHGGDESVAAGYHAVDAYDTYSQNDVALSGGVTTVHLSPGQHRLLTGQGAVVKLAGRPGSRVLIEQADLTINLGDSVFDPPVDMTFPFPASSDVAIKAPIRQRPASRLGQFLALDEALAGATRGDRGPSFSIHTGALADALDQAIPMRVHAQRAADISGALRYLSGRSPKDYLVGGAEAHLVASELAASGRALVYELGGSLRRSAPDAGSNPDTLVDDISNLSALGDTTLALSVGAGAPLDDFRLTAATALRAGLSERRVIEAITRVPAEILGVADRVGSLTVGKDADLIVLSGPPLATTTHVQQVFVDGESAFTAPRNPALVIKAGTVWVDDKTQIRNGAVLIENGKIVAVGRTVPHPPFARVIDAGEHAYITPGLIDAHGHLGLENDRTAPPPEISLSELIGAPDLAELRVARAGVTTVMLSPYAANAQGSQIAAVKTAGDSREDRVVRRGAGMLFDVRSTDGYNVQNLINRRLNAAKAYQKQWKDYETKLAAWKKAQETGEPQAAVEETTEEAEETDPISGTWSITVTGLPFDGVSAIISLTGDQVEGRFVPPDGADETAITGTFDGKHLSITIAAPAGFGELKIEADLDEPDHLTGTLTAQGTDYPFEARRTAQEEGRVRVAAGSTRGKDGRPLPPKVDPALEVLKDVLEHKAALVVNAQTPLQIESIMRVAQANKIKIVLLNAEGAQVHAGRIAEYAAGVIVPSTIVRRQQGRPYHQSDDLSRLGIPVAFQSNAEDGARNLPLVALHAVERGLSADEALAALTVYPSRMFHLDDRIGTLKAGTDGDVVVFSGHPLEAGSRVLHTIINGKEIR